MYHSSAQLFIPRTTPCIKALIIVNLVCWFVLIAVVQNFFMKTDGIYRLLGFVPSSISHDFFLWQFVTYMFIHSKGFFHILFNMLILWMFGSELEQLWKKRFFLLYYFVCGVGSALVYFMSVQLYSLFSGYSSVMDVPVIGASGAVFGLILAYGLIFGDRIVLFMFIFPMKAKYLTLLIAGIELLTVLNSGFGSPVANLAHLGGLISGFLFLNFRSIIQKMSMKRIFKRRLKILDN